MARNEKGQFVPTHGYCKGNTQHRLWGTWRGIRRRCLDVSNKDYHNYGARGITICERWMDFGSFVEDMLPTWKEGLTLGRKDNNGNYEPGNCRWETAEQQNSNRRDNILLEYGGIALPATTWARVVGIKKETMFSRIRRGSSDLLSKPRTVKTIEFNGVTKTISEWARELNINEATIRSRLNYGFSTKELFGPLQRAKTKTI